jgi:hypothetical protein
VNSLPYLIAEMRLAGVKRLEIELEADATDRGERKQWAEGFASDTERPPEEPEEEKAESMCAAPDCKAPREGLFGGSAAAKFCRSHALEQAGVKR